MFVELRGLDKGFKVDWRGGGQERETGGKQREEAPARIEVQSQSTTSLCFEPTSPPDD